MSIGNAISFITSGMVDPKLRKRLNRARNLSELKQLLAEDKFQFSRYEFAAAFDTMLVKCRLEEQAGRLKEFRLWWELLVGHLPAAIQTREKGRHDEKNHIGKNF